MSVAFLFNIVGIMLGWICHKFVIILGWCLHHFGMIVSSCWYEFAILLGWFWHHLCISSAPFGPPTSFYPSGLRRNLRHSTNPLREAPIKGGALKGDIVQQAITNHPPPDQNFHPQCSWEWGESIQDEFLINFPLGFIQHGWILTCFMTMFVLACATYCMGATFLKFRSSVS